MVCDFEQLRFRYEVKLLKVLAGCLGASGLIGHHRAQHLLETRRKELLGDAVRITPDLLPEVYHVYQGCLDAIGGGLQGELFVQQSRQYNASVFAHEKKFDVLIHSALLNDFSLDELKFVFGHELGHVVFEHSRFPINEILARDPHMPPEVANLLFRWSRASEVSADRIGLMCCGTLPAAISALFKTSSGLMGIDVDRILRSFRTQYEDLEQQIRSVKDSLSWIRTHPMIPIRFKALELAALDIVAFCKGMGTKGFRKIDDQITRILETLDQYFFPSTHA